MFGKVLSETGFAHMEIATGFIRFNPGIEDALFAVIGEITSAAVFADFSIIPVVVGKNA
jgi:hypothetical protein